MLRSIPEIKLEDIVIGQYVGNENGTGPEKEGYLDDKTVPPGFSYYFFVSLIKNSLNKKDTLRFNNANLRLRNFTNKK